MRPVVRVSLFGSLLCGLLAACIAWPVSAQSPAPAGTASASAEPKTPRPPIHDASQPWPADALLPAPVRPWLPPANTPDAPRPLPGELGPQPMPPPRPMPHVPELARQSVEMTPPALGVMPRATAPSPDATRLTAIVLRLAGVRNRPAVADDPTERQAGKRLLGEPVSADHKPADFVRLDIPEPFRAIEEVQLRQPPADTDPPAGRLFAPPCPKLDAAKQP